MAFLFKSVADGAYSEALTWHTTYNITAVVTGTKTFTIAGDRADEFATGQLILQGSTLGINDGTYTIVSATFIVDHTAIIVVEPIPSSSASGHIRSTNTPIAGDLVLVNGFTVTLDVQVENLGSFEVNNGTAASSLGAVDPFGSYGGTIVVSGTSTLRSMTTSRNLTINEVTSSPTSVRMDNVTLSGQALAIDSGNVDWDGLMTTGTVTIGDTSTAVLNGNATGLTFSGTPIHLGNNATDLGGTITFKNGSTVDDTGLSGAFNFGGTFYIRSALNLANSSVNLIGSMYLYAALTVPTSATYSFTAFHLMTPSASFVSAMTVTYSGPAGGAMGNFRLGL